MKTVLTLIVSFYLFYNTAYAGIIVMEGKYQNKNIYIQNAYAGQGVGFCTYAVYVNGKLTSDEINSTAFEIDLEQCHLKTGDDLFIKIYHKEGCSPPRVLNPSALKPIPTFEITQMRITNDGFLTWVSKNENTAMPYIIEQFRWNKWVYIGEIRGLGGYKENNYKFLITSLHSGENSFRIKQTGYQTKYSSNVKTISSLPKCVFSTSKNARQINFTCRTLYEVYDFYGAVVKKGYGFKVDIANLKNGGYYVCYDNSIGEVKKK